MRDAAAQAELVVHIGTLHNGWTEVADVLLPGHTVAEKHGTFVNRQRRVQRIQPALHAPEAARADHRILAELLAALGKGRDYADARAVLAALGQQDGPFKGLDWDAVGEQGVALDGGAAERQAGAS